MDIGKIREACTLRKIKWSVHVAARMAERDIKRNDVINCIMKGEHFFTFNDRKVTYLQTSQKTDYICRVIVQRFC